MGWSFGYALNNFNPDLDRYLLIIGRAIYLSCEFERKCKYVCVVSEREDEIVRTACIDFSKEITKEKLLNSAIKRMQKLGHYKAVNHNPEYEKVLEDGRLARNYIAHEAALIGPFGGTFQPIEDNKVKLLSHVRNLIEADNLISRIIYALEDLKEYESIPLQIQCDNRDFFMNWIFRES